MLRSRCRRLPRAERGASAVEFAIILPVLVLLVGAIIDFGFVFAQQLALNNGTRDAARTAIVDPLSSAPLTCTQINTTAKNAMVGGVGMNPAAVSFALSRSDGDNPCAAATPCAGAAQGVTLQLAATYSSTPPFPLPYMNPIVLTSKGVFRCEYA